MVFFAMIQEENRAYAVDAIPDGFVLSPKPGQQERFDEIARMAVALSGLAFDAKVLDSLAQAKKLLIRGHLTGS